MNLERIKELVSLAISEAESWGCDNYRIEDYLRQIFAELEKQSEACDRIGRAKEIITLANKALGHVYSDTHPMPKLAISSLLSQIKILAELENMNNVQEKKP